MNNKQFKAKIKNIRPNTRTDDEDTWSEFGRGFYQKGIFTFSPYLSPYKNYKNWLLCAENRKIYHISWLDKQNENDLFDF